jgi:polyhydroxybutyrate depolymerase
MTVDGKVRDYRLFVPPSLDNSKANPLVIVLHGSPIDAAGFETTIHFDAEAAAAHFITASPNGCGGFWSYSEGGPKVADEDFIRNVIADARSEFRIAKVFVMGASAGSKTAYRLACDFADDISGIASVAGTMNLKDTCTPSRPVSILEIHGTDDAQIPWEGGGDHGAYPVEDVSRRWRTIDACVGDPLVTQTGSDVASVWNRCDAGAVVRLDKVIGGGHTWFQTNPVTAEPDANRVIGAFFTSLSG